jgi:hypothetical protein
LPVAPVTRIGVISVSVGISLSIWLLVEDQSVVGHREGAVL